MQNLTYKTELLGIPIDESDIVRFKKKLKITNNNCWIFTGKKNSNGYGMFAISHNGIGKNVKSNRFAYTVFVGSIPEKLSICHTCDNRECCNPAHLWAGTHKENMHDAINKSRFKIPQALVGEDSHFSKLGETEVLRTRSLYNSYNSSLNSFCIKYSDVFNISKTQIYRIIKRTSWAHIP